MKAKTFAGWTLGSWFGCGLFPVAPGTVGTLGTLPLYYLVRSGGHLAVLATAAVVTAIGVWASNVVVADAKQKDPQRIVIDESAGVLLSLAAAPMTTKGVIAAVVLFRLLDITKPPPCRRLEHLPAGWGVMMDDVAAGAWAVAILFVLRAVGVI